MDINASINEKIAEYERRRHRTALEEAVKRELTVNGGMAAAVANIAGLIHGAQQNSNIHNQQANANQVYQGTAHFPNMQPGAVFAGTYPDDGEHVTQGILKGFESKDKSTYEFAAATAQLLSAKIRASYSPNRSPHCTPRHEHIVWQLFNHNWMVDVQWVGDATGGSEEEWTKHFAKLADRISEAREAGEKQWGDEPMTGALSPGAIQRAQQMLGMAQRMSQAGMQQSSQLMAGQAASNLGLYSFLNTQGQQNASFAGQSPHSSLAGSGGSSAEAAAFGSPVGMGF